MRQHLAEGVNPVGAAVDLQAASLGTVVKDG